MTIRDSLWSSRMNDTESSIEKSATRSPMQYLKAPSERRGYPSDLTERQWERVAAILPPAELLGRPLSHDLREVVNALSYRWRTGCSWRMLPHDLPPWGTVYRWERRWTRRGCLDQIRDLTRYNDHLASRHAGDSSTAWGGARAW